MAYNILQTLDSVSEFSRGCSSVKAINFNKKEKGKKLKEKKDVMTREEAEYAKYIGVDIDDDGHGDAGNYYNDFPSSFSKDPAIRATTHFTNNSHQERRRDRGGMGRGSWLKSGVSNYNYSHENNFSRPFAPSNRQFHNDRVISQQLRGVVESVSNEEIENRFALKFGKSSPVNESKLGEEKHEVADSVCSSSELTSRPTRGHPDRLVYVPPHLRNKQPETVCNSESESRGCSLACDYEHTGDDIYMSDENDAFCDNKRPKTPLDGEIASKVNCVYDPIPDCMDTVSQLDSEPDDSCKIGKNMKFIMKSKQLDSSRSTKERPTRNALLNGLLKKIAEENNDTKNEVLLNSSSSSSSTPVHEVYEDAKTMWRDDNEELKCNSINLVSSDSSRCLSCNSSITNSSCSSPNYYTADSSASSKNSSFVENIKNKSPKIHPTIFTLADFLPNGSSSLNPHAKPFNPLSILDSGNPKPFNLDAADFPPLGI